MNRQDEDCRVRLGIGHNVRHNTDLPYVPYMSCRMGTERYCSPAIVCSYPATVTGGHERDMPPMTSTSEPVNPDPANPVPGFPRRRDWLALTSVLLSFTPLVVWVLTFALGSVLFPPIPTNINYYTSAGPYTQQYFTVTFLAGLISLAGSVSAIVTSRLALGRAKRLPHVQAWQGLAEAGRALGIIGIVVACVIAPCTVVALWAQNYHGG